MGTVSFHVTSNYIIPPNEIQCDSQYFPLGYMDHKCMRCTFYRVANG